MYKSINLVQKQQPQLLQLICRRSIVSTTTTTAIKSFATAQVREKKQFNQESRNETRQQFQAPTRTEVDCLALANNSMSSKTQQLNEKVSLICEQHVYDASAFKSVAKYVHTRIEDKLETSSFLVTNLATVVKQFKQWQKELPGLFCNLFILLE